MAINICIYVHICMSIVYVSYTYRNMNSRQIVAVQHVSASYLSHQNVTQLFALTCRIHITRQYWRHYSSIYMTADTHIPPFWGHRKRGSFHCECKQNGVWAMKGKCSLECKQGLIGDKSLEPYTPSTFQGKFAIQFYILNDAILLKHSCGVTSP